MKFWEIIGDLFIPGPEKTYAQRKQETERLTTHQIQMKISQRMKSGQKCGVLYEVLADRADAEANRNSTESVTERRRKYQDRYNQAIQMTESARLALIAEREAQNLPCGVLYRAQANFDRE